jgi:hypothetical protein
MPSLLPVVLAQVLEPENLRFGGGSSGTVLHPLVAVAMAAIIGLILCLPRKQIIFPLLLGVFCIPKGQVLVLAGIHLTVARVLILCALGRWLAAGGPSFTGSFGSGFKRIDRAFAGCAIATMVIFSLQWMEAQAFVKSAGDLLDALGSYIALRFVIQQREDVRHAIQALAIIAVFNAIIMIEEQRTGSNLLGLLGGHHLISTVRDGKIRSQGAFAVYITAGVFGSTLVPLLVWAWTESRSRFLVLMGICGAVVMTLTCQASTSISTLAGGLAALCLWPIRRRMRFLRWAIVLMILTLHVVMNGPVWWLIAKVDLTGSSSSYHRYLLVDSFIRHCGEWWLLGIKDYSSWGHMMWDLSNHYVMVGLNGGLIALGCFIAVIARSFGRIGDIVKSARDNRKEQWLHWCLGSAVFAHVIAFLGIGYFDQIQYSWAVLLAIISVSRPAPTFLKPTQAARTVEWQDELATTVYF